MEHGDLESREVNDHHINVKMWIVVYLHDYHEGRSCLYFCYGKLSGANMVAVADKVKTWKILQSWKSFIQALGCLDCNFLKTC